MTDQRLIEAMQFYAEDAEWDARAFSSTEPGASLLADAAVGKAIAKLPEDWTLTRRDGSYALDIHGPGIEVDIGVGAMQGPPEVIAGGTGPTLEAAIAKALGDES